MKPEEPYKVTEKLSKEVLLALAAFIYESEIREDYGRLCGLMTFLIFSYPSEDFVDIEHIFEKETLGERIFSGIQNSNVDCYIFDLIFSLFAPYLGDMLETMMNVEKVELKITWKNTGTETPPA